MATKSKLLPGFQRVKSTGNNERFINTETGIEISRRAYDKIRRGLSNEQLRDINAEIEPEKQLARPARGRSSALKAPAEVRRDIVAARKEEQTQRKRREAELKEQQKITNKIEREKARKVKRKVIRKQLLVPGRMGARISFNDYSEYLDAVKEAKKSGVVFSYSLGWHGVDERTGLTRDVTVFTGASVNLIRGEDEFDAEFEASIEEKSYMIFLNYWMHVAFSKSFAEEWAKRNGKGIQKSTMDKFR